jgi:signal peptidase I
MKPALSYGDVVYAAEKDPSEIKADEEDGDIVVIKGPQYYYEQGFDPIFWNHIENNTRIIHRVVDKKLVNGTWYISTKGDNSMWPVDGIFQTLNKTEDYFLFEYNSSNLIYITEEAIIGVILFKIPFLGYLEDIFPILIVSLIALLIINILFKRFNYELKIVKNKD